MCNEKNRFLDLKFSIIFCFCLIQCEMVSELKIPVDYKRPGFIFISFLPFLNILYSFPSTRGHSYSITHITLTSRLISGVSWFLLPIGVGCNAFGLSCTAFLFICQLQCSSFLSMIRVDIARCSWDFAFTIDKVTYCHNPIQMK